MSGDESDRQPAWDEPGREALPGSACTGFDAAESLGAMVTDPDWFVRWGAARLLGSRGDERAVSRLCELLRDEVPVVRRRAMEALARLAVPSALRSMSTDTRSVLIDSLIRTLRDPDAGIRERAAAALVRLGVQSVPALLDALRRGPAAVRGQTAGILGTLRDEWAFMPLADALKADSDPWVRATAARALPRCGGAAAVPLLGQALADRADTVRAAAGEALAEAAPTDPDAAAALLPALQALRREAEGHLNSRWAAAGFRRAIQRIEAVVNPPGPGRRLSVPRSIWGPLPVPATSPGAHSERLPLPVLRFGLWRSRRSTVPPACGCGPLRRALDARTRAGDSPR